MTARVYSKSPASHIASGLAGVSASDFRETKAVMVDRNLSLYIELALMQTVVVALMLLAVPAWAADRIARGLYYFGAEVESFHPCDSKKAYWVVGEEEMLKPLRERTDQLRKPHRAYPPIYVEFVGEVDHKEKRDGYAEDYDALFQLRKVVRASNMVPRDCPMRASSTVERDARKSSARPSP